MISIACGNPDGELTLNNRGDAQSLNICKSKAFKKKYLII